PPPLPQAGGHLPHRVLQHVGLVVGGQDDGDGRGHAGRLPTPWTRPDAAPSAVLAGLTWAPVLSLAGFTWAPVLSPRSWRCSRWCAPGWHCVPPAAAPPSPPPPARCGPRTGSRPCWPRPRAPSTSGGPSTSCWAAPAAAAAWR